MKQKEILHKMVEISNYLYEKGLVPGKSGNISIKFKNNADEQIAVTPSGLSLKALNENDIIIVDMKGNMTYRTGKKPTSELLMHLKIYYNRDNVNAVVHTHSPIATGFSFANEKIERMEGFGPIQSQFIPSIEYYSPGSVELAETVSKALEKTDAIILKDHGVVTLGKNLDEASLLAEFIEESAKTQFIKQILMANRL